jgi:hypothetical protein
MAAILYFYRSIGLFTGIISLALWALADLPLHNNFHVFLPRYLIIKLITDYIILRYIRKYRMASQRYFYHNLGISETRLYLTAFGLDILIFFLLVAVVKMYTQL